MILLNSACNLPVQTPTLVGTVLPTGQAPSASTAPIPTWNSTTPTIAIPVTGMDAVVALQCEFCVNDETHAVLLLPQAASFLVSEPITGISCLTAQVVNGQRILICRGAQQVAFTLNVCLDTSNCLQFPVTLQKCPITPQTGVGAPQPTLSSAPILLTPVITLIPSATSTSTPTPLPTQIPTWLPTQTSTSLPPVPATAATAPHAQPTRRSSSTLEPGAGLQDPAEFARWYFGRVWNDRNYQDLWDNFLTQSFKSNVSPGGYDDYVTWWDSVQRVDVNSVDVLQNDGTHAWIHVNVNFHLKDGRILENREYDYYLLYETNRKTWMFDY